MKGVAYRIYEHFKRTPQASLTPPEHSRVEFANTLRGVAVLCVVLHHLLGNFWRLRGGTAHYANMDILPDTVPSPELFNTIFTPTYFNFGQFGVGLFFLVSGFVIPFSLGRFNAAGFLAARLLRIYPTYAVCFSLTLLTFLVAGLIYQNPFPEFTESQIIAQYLVGVRLWMNEPLIDNILWTLEIEVHFYVLCALGAYGFKKRSLMVFAIPVIMATLSNTYASMGLPQPLNRFFEATYAPLFIVYMFIGTTFFYGYHGVLKGKTVWYAVAIMAAVAYMSAPSLIQRNQVLCTSYGVAVLVFAAAFALRERIRPTQVTSFSADISYPLYAVHSAMGYLILRVLLDLGMGAYSATAAVCAILMCVCCAIHALVERPSQALGRWLGKRITELPVTDFWKRTPRRGQKPPSALADDTTAPVL